MNDRRLRMKGWLWATTALVLLVALPLRAAETDQMPSELVRQASDKMLGLISDKADQIKQNPEIVHSAVEQTILPIIDFEAFSRLVLGKQWRQASPAQRERFREEFKGMLIRTYAVSVADYPNAKLQILPERGQQGDEYRSVYTRVAPGGGERPFSVNYQFRSTDEGWKVYDVTVDGLSVVKNFRTSFTREINQKGLDALIARLAKADTEKEAERLRGPDGKASGARR